MEPVDLFSEWLKQRRKTLDLTQGELASRAGCSIFALRKIESGERRPSKQLAGLLADALQISEGDKQNFVRIARGEMALGRWRAPSPTPVSSSDASAALSTEVAPHRLPLPATPLLGRDSELAAMERIFDDPQCRLLTLTGMGGIGKTRLALEFAARQQARFSGGVHFVPLASINSAESIIPAIAEALAFSFSGPVNPKEQLFSFMASDMSRPMLLVLDNLEHLIVQSSVATDLAAELLQRLPGLKILATSRERLNLHDEWMYEIHGLLAPPEEFTDKLDAYSATALFVQRARHINPDFVVSGSERLNLVRICRLVEGVPLAIELAAAWTGMLTCAEIAQELESSIDILTTTMRDMPERHHSLRATFDHSWGLLSALERDVLSRLAVFHGGFNRLAAEPVAGASLAILASLASKSLVKRGEEGRYDLHEVIRQYSLSRLGQSPLQHDQARDRHCDYYLQLVAGRESALKSAGLQDAVRELARDMDNIRAAWEWGIQRARFDIIEKSARSFGWIFDVLGLHRDGIEQLELLVQSLKDKRCTAMMSRALGAALSDQGVLCFRTGQFARALERYDQSIAVLRSVDALALLADPLIINGVIRQLNGDYPKARESVEEGTRIAQATDDRWFTAYGIYVLGFMDSWMGKYEKGYQQMQEGMKIWREVGDPHGITIGLSFLVRTQIALGRYDEAKASMHESLALCEQTKNRWGMATTYRFLGLVTLAEGQVAEAQAYFRKSLETFGAQFEGWDIARTLIYLGDAVLRSGDAVGGAAIYTEALRVAREAESIPLILDALTGLAEIDLQTGETGRAQRRSRRVLCHSASSQEAKDRASRILAETADHHDAGQDGASQGSNRHSPLTDESARVSC